MIRADITAALDYYLALAVAALGTEEEPFKGKKFIQPGAEVAWDQCDCDGQVWSKFITATPVYETPKANGIPCVVRWDVQLAVGVLRCVAGPNARGVLPDGDQITADGHKFADDLLNLMTAIECDTTKYRLIEAVGLGPEGSCAGSEVRFTVRMEPCCK